MDYYKVNDERLQDWLLEHEPEDKMLWKEAWWNNNVFIRDRILRLFSDNYDVVGSHYSKSIECPVVKTEYRGVTIIWQYNFYDWQIMVESPLALFLYELDTINALGNYFYYQGIPQEYRFKPYNFIDNNRHFAIDITTGSEFSWGGRIDVWAFAVMVKKAIDDAIFNSKVDGFIY